MKLIFLGHLTEDHLVTTCVLNSSRDEICQQNIMKIKDLSLILIFLKFCVSEESPLTFEEWYEMGKEAYLENSWEKCVENIEKSLETYHTHIKAILTCGLQCKNPKNQSIFNDNQDLELVFFEHKIKTTLCLLQCKAYAKDFKKDNEYVSKEVTKEFEEYEPYNYLQLCYHQVLTFFLICFP